MTKKIAKNIIIGSLILVAILGMGLYANIIKLPITREIQVLYAADFSDDKILMGASHNVFVGKVINQVGNKERDIGPETQFEVEVVYNIKGNLQGSVVVNQQGGYKNGILYLVRGGDVVAPADKENTDLDSLLELETTYLFATRYSKQENWYMLISHSNGKKIIGQDGNLNAGQLQVLAGRAGKPISKDTILEKYQLEILAQNDERVKKLQEAYKNEILLDQDVIDNNTRNSYQSLQGNR